MVGLDSVQVVNALQVVFGQGPTHGSRARVALGAVRQGLFSTRTLSHPACLGLLQRTTLLVPLSMASLNVKLRTTTDDGHNTTRTHDWLYNIIKANDQERVDQYTTQHSRRALCFIIL